MENQHRAVSNETPRGSEPAGRDVAFCETDQNNQPKPYSARQIFAAGGVLWRTSLSGAVEVSGIYRPSCDNWSLPKGKLDHAEHRLAGACREVHEETGIVPVPQAFLTTAQYQLSHPDGAVTKYVDFWSMRTLNPQAEFVPNAEVTKQRWLRLDEAVALLTRPRDQQALSTFRQLPTITSTIILLRHASAETAGPRTDQARRLDITGAKQANDLVPLLRLYHPQQIVSATPLRCVRTVAPLSSAVGVKVEADPSFDVDAHLRNPERAANRLRQLASSHATITVCSQGPVISDCLAILSDTDGVGIPNLETEVAHAWVLSFTNKALVAIERLLSTD